jgi:hypothetical protein
VPTSWGKDQSGMQVREELPADLIEHLKIDYHYARQGCLEAARSLDMSGLHKQDVNGLLMPWSWAKQIITGTQWANFFALRTHKDAHPAMQRIARLMYLAYRKSVPVELDYDQWYLPYCTEADKHYWQGHNDVLLRISVARWARVSYWNHEGKKDYVKDDELYQKLLGDPVIKHIWPFAHQGRPALAVELASHPEWRSNLAGWLQYRKLIPGECIREFNPSEEEIASWGLSLS